MAKDATSPPPDMPMMPIQLLSASPRSQRVNSTYRLQHPHAYRCPTGHGEKCRDTVAAVFRQTILDVFPKPQITKAQHLGNDYGKAFPAQRQCEIFLITRVGVTARRPVGQQADDVPIVIIMSRNGYNGRK